MMTPRDAVHLSADAVEDFEQLADALIDAGKFIDSRGWVPATSGNFSARLADGRIAMTVSGRHKGRLTRDDIMLVDADGLSLDGKKPSAESFLHVALYRRYPEIGAVLHPHSPGSVVISRLFDKELILEGYELLKALKGIHTHEVRVVVPIFANDQDIPRLAGRVDEYLDEFGDILAYIIAGHGFYTWSDTVAGALHQVEALEYLFEIEARLRGLKS